MRIKIIVGAVQTNAVDRSIEAWHLKPDDNLIPLLIVILRKAIKHGQKIQYVCLYHSTARVPEW